jgi:transposase-like protein
MLVELRLVEQRYQAVLEVINDGASVTDVARRYGVARQTVHQSAAEVLARRASRVGGSSLAPVVASASDERGGESARRRAAPAASGWGPRTILY